MRAPPLVYHPRYSCPWPAAHRFPMWKFADLFDVVQRQRWCHHFSRPRPACTVHQQHAPRSPAWRSDLLHARLARVRARQLALRCALPTTLLTAMLTSLQPPTPLVSLCRYSPALVHTPTPLPSSAFTAVHQEAYYRAFSAGILDDDAARRIGFRGEIANPALIERTKLEVAGTELVRVRP